MKWFFGTVMTVIVMIQTGDTVNFCEGQDCPVCFDNMHGPHCNISCPANCNSGCERTTGKCDLGCTNNTYGERCEKQCPLNCNQGCNQTTADCYECKPGFHGNKCKTNCSLYCEVCEQRNGHCLKWSRAVYPTRTFKTVADSKEESSLQRVGMTCGLVLTPFLFVLGCFATTIIKDKNVIQKK